MFNFKKVATNLKNAIINKKDSRKFENSETTFSESEKQKEINKAEISSCAFEQVCERLAKLNLYADIKPNEWDAFFEAIYDCLASKKTENNIENFMKISYAGLWLNRVKVFENITDSTIDFNTFLGLFELSVNYFGAALRVFGLTFDDLDNIKENIAERLADSKECNNSKCLVYNIEDYKKNN